MNLTIQGYMTRSPTTVEASELVSAASAIMRRDAIRHLPVTTGGVLVGILSERDVDVAVAAGGSSLAVAAVMVAQPFAIASHSSLEWVAMEMSERKCGSVVVVDDGQVAGMFTTTDALRALEELLRRSRRRRRPTS